MFEIEVDYVQVCSCNISDVDEQRIKDYIKSNPEKFKFMSEKKAIIEAIFELKIDLFNDYVELTGYTNDIRWSEFEDRSAEEILNNQYQESVMGRFKPGDRVYHRNLKQYGIFVEYAWESKEECDVDFEMDDGEIEQKHVSVSWLDLVE